MPDPADPWDNPPGNLTVRLHVEAVAPEARVVRCAARQRPVLLVAGSAAVVPAAAAGGVVGATLREALEAEEMEREDDGKSFAAAAATTAMMTQQERRRTTSPAQLLGVCLVVSDGRSGSGAPSLAAQALMAAATASLRPLRWVIAHAVCGADDAASAPAELLLDEEWTALLNARAIVIDFNAGIEEDDGTAAAAASADDAEEAVCSSDDVKEEALLAACEQRIRGATATLARGGVLAALWAAHWRGVCVAGVGAGGVALLGAAPPSSGDGKPLLPPQRTLLPMPVRAGGGRRGWSALHAALASWPDAAASSGDDADGSSSSTNDALTGVGVLTGSALSVDPSIWWQARVALYAACCQLCACIAGFSLRLLTITFCAIPRSLRAQRSCWSRRRARRWWPPPPRWPPRRRAPAGAAHYALTTRSTTTTAARAGRTQMRASRSVPRAAWRAVRARRREAAAAAARSARRRQSAPEEE
jgi:hypothetical protein